MCSWLLKVHSHDEDNTHQNEKVPRQAERNPEIDYFRRESKPFGKFASIIRLKLASFPKIQKKGDLSKNEIR